VSLEEVKNFASSSNCKFGSLSFIYLGLPVGRDMSKVISWLDIDDRFNKRLSSWKAKNLSFGGRLTLYKVVLGILPTYYLSLFRAPKEVINSLEKNCSRFLGFKEGEKGIVWVKWKSILASFNKGGLGVGSVHAKNLSLLAKWRWHYYTECDALWRKVIWNLYGHAGGFLPNVGRGCKKVVWASILSARLDSLVCDISLRDGSNDGWDWLLNSGKDFIMKHLSKMIDGITLRGNNLGGQIRAPFPTGSLG
nr:reverse transcriptase domain, reverse transcriptase zinc-binding domain protein [Tanacetum cinerariifolium]